MEMPISQNESKNVIAPQTGAAFLLKSGHFLKVATPTGHQVSDLFCLSCDNPDHHLSTSRSMDYADSLFLSTGDYLYSNLSDKMLKIESDSCGRHDLLMPPCSEKMFHIVNKNKKHHPSCHENLYKSLAPFKIKPEQISTTFNIFMNVTADPKGKVKIHTPLAKPKDHIIFKAMMDLFVGLTACSHPESNGGECKPIEYWIYDEEGRRERPMKRGPLHTAPLRKKLNA